ncbi:hypothetical protein GLOIN_2v1791382 [Rhizophagus clarus]|uniref:Uncharacterized protein n=1 Tax=Rhizophagus clarus TaxID=94130 RepID=A0A8H3QNL5_9GLOM|nr:hypothetical protein GLOIN_2v1791382 [Rhizophagus clarus]
MLEKQGEELNENKNSENLENINEESVIEEDNNKENDTGNKKENDIEVNIKNNENDENNDNAINEESNSKEEEDGVLNKENSEGENYEMIDENNSNKSKEGEENIIESIIQELSTPVIHEVTVEENESEGEDIDENNFKRLILAYDKIRRENSKLLRKYFNHGQVFIKILEKMKREEGKVLKKGRENLLRKKIYDEIALKLELKKIESERINRIRKVYDKDILRLNEEERRKVIDGIKGMNKRKIYRQERLKLHMRWHERGKKYEYSDKIYDYGDNWLGETEKEICNIYVKEKSTYEYKGIEMNLACQKAYAEIKDFNGMTVQKVKNLIIMEETRWRNVDKCIRNIEEGKVIEGENYILNKIIGSRAIEIQGFLIIDEVVEERFESFWRWYKEEIVPTVLPLKNYIRAFQLNDEVTRENRRKLLGITYREGEQLDEEEEYVVISVRESSPRRINVRDVEKIKDLGFNRETMTRPGFLNIYEEFISETDEILKDKLSKLLEKEKETIFEDDDENIKESFEDRVDQIREKEENIDKKTNRIFKEIKESLGIATLEEVRKLIEWGYARSEISDNEIIFELRKLQIELNLYDDDDDEVKERLSTYVAEWKVKKIRKDIEEIEEYESENGEIFGDQNNKNVINTPEILESENSSLNINFEEEEINQEYEILRDLFRTPSPVNNMTAQRNKVREDIKLVFQAMFGHDIGNNWGALQPPANDVLTAIGNVRNAVRNLAGPVNRAAKIGDLPLYYKGEQDVYEWIRDFNTVFIANGY